MSGAVFIGTSGWSYTGWKDSFYAGIPRKDWLAYCAGNFTGIEVNTTFYGLQKRSVFERWRVQTPPDFRFAVKGNRSLTHNKKLLAPASMLLRHKERVGGLGDKLAAMLWQVPANQEKNLDRLAEFVRHLSRWTETRHVMEFRHLSWFDQEVASLLTSHRVAVCLSHAAAWPLWDCLTTDFAYLRLHGYPRTYASSYGPAELAGWAKRIRQWRREGCQVHVYFNNDAEGAAPYDALRLLELCRQQPMADNMELL
ncbi:MAG: DUF72 domain-containing protein [Deltaproteobacteria bacterium]|nr:DUF72 domain-containing protein [Candidatus Anaeroferrophillus wilburensis]MBN2889999.1 DUF72 domain-containing protein [Deltaproteobacteria bacterium]